MTQGVQEEILGRIVDGRCSGISSMSARRANSIDAHPHNPLAFTSPSHAWLPSFLNREVNIPVPQTPTLCTWWMSSFLTSAMPCAVTWERDMLPSQAATILNVVG